VKKILLMGMVVALLLGLQVLGPAQLTAAESSEPAAAPLKPLVTVALSGYDEILSDLQSISPQIAMLVEGQINAATGNQGLEGLDKTRPWGLLVRTDEQQFPVQLFVPVTDLAKLLKSLEPVIGTTEAKDGVYEIDAGGRTLYLKQVGDWAFASISSDGLANLPEKPLEALGGLQDEYDLGIRLTVKNIPVSLRQMGLALMQTAMQQGLQKQPDETEEQHAVRVKAVEQSMKQVSQAVNEIDELVLGLKIDNKAGNAYFDFVQTAVEGSELAKQIAGAGAEQETKFAGFVMDDAAFTFSGAQLVPEASAAQLEPTLASARSEAMKHLEKEEDLGEEEKTLAKELTNGLFDVAEKTVKGGKFDVGGSVNLGPEVLTLVFGARVLETQKVDDMLKKLAEKVAKEDPKAADAIKLDAEKYEGVRLHRISVPTEELGKTDDVDLKKLVGDTVDVFIGIGEESVYVAAGRDALQTLKTAIDKSKEPKKVAPMQLKLAVTPLVKFAGSIAEDSQVQNVANILGQILEGTPGKDHIVVTSTVVPNGGKMRIELEQGILKVLGALPMLAAM
jgi:hypothetical protein